MRVFLVVVAFLLVKFLPNSIRTSLLLVCEYRDGSIDVLL